MELFFIDFEWAFDPLGRPKLTMSNEYDNGKVRS